MVGFMDLPDIKVLTQKDINPTQYPNQSQTPQAAGMLWAPSCLLNQLETVVSVLGLRTCPCLNNGFLHVRVVCALRMQQSFIGEET